MYNQRERTYGQNGRQVRQFSESGPAKHYELTEQNYVELADQIMKEQHQTNRNLTTSKIRNILAMVSDLYNDVRMVHTDRIDAEMAGRIQYLRLHIAYEAGRANEVRDFVDSADLMNQLSRIGDDKKKLILFCHYMEALVAYHRYYGGRDN